MHQGHHGANHPVKDLPPEKVEIHLDESRLSRSTAPACRITWRRPTCRVRRIELRIALKGAPCSPWQYHPEPRRDPATATNLFDRLSVDAGEPADMTVRAPVMLTFSFPPRG